MHLVNGMTLTVSWATMAANNFSCNVRRTSTTLYAEPVITASTEQKSERDERRHSNLCQTILLKWFHLQQFSAQQVHWASLNLAAVPVTKSNATANAICTCILFQSRWTSMSAPYHLASDQIIFWRNFHGIDLPLRQTRTQHTLCTATPYVKIMWTLSTQHTMAHHFTFSVFSLSLNKFILIVFVRSVFYLSSSVSCPSLF